MRFISVIFTSIFLIVFVFFAYAEENTEANEKIRFCGTLEEEVGYMFTKESKNSDFALSTAELGADINLSDDVSGKIVFLYEQGENDNNIIIDQGTISLNMPCRLPIELALTLGRSTIPFGKFDSCFVSDPYTLEIGETKQVMLMASAFFKDIVEFAVCAYNEDINIDNGDDHISDIASSLAISKSDENFGFVLGGSFTTNIAGSDGLTEIIGDNRLLEKALGFGGFASINAMNAFLNFEYILAIEDIRLENDRILKPQAFNFELGYLIPNTPISLVGKFERYSEDNENTINRFGGVVSFDLFKGKSSLAIEFLRTDNGDSPENSIISQLAISF